MFNQLKNAPFIEDDKNNSWKISKKYSKNEFNPNESSLGYEIEVYNESIGETFNEYLVNFEYFISMCAKYNMRLVEKVDFKDIFGEISNIKYGNITAMNEELKTYSFLNSYFIFEKGE